MEENKNKKNNLIDLIAIAVFFAFDIKLSEIVVRHGVGEAVTIKKSKKKDMENFFFASFVTFFQNRICYWEQIE